MTKAKKRPLLKDFIITQKVYIVSSGSYVYKVFRFRKEADAYYEFMTAKHFGDPGPFYVSEKIIE